MEGGGGEVVVANAEGKVTDGSRRPRRGTGGGERRGRREQEGLFITRVTSSSMTSSSLSSSSLPHCPSPLPPYPFFCFFPPMLIAGMNLFGSSRVPPSIQASTVAEGWRRKRAEACLY